MKTTIRRAQEDTCQVRCYNPDGIDVRFDDERLVADAGLLLPATLAVGLGLRELLDTYVDLGQAPGRANVGDKAISAVTHAAGTPASNARSNMTWASCGLVRNATCSGTRAARQR